MGWAVDCHLVSAAKTVGKAVVKAAKTVGKAVVHVAKTVGNAVVKVADVFVDVFKTMGKVLWDSVMTAAQFIKAMLMCATIGVKGSSAYGIDLTPIPVMASFAWALPLPISQNNYFSLSAKDAKTWMDG